MAWNIVQRYSQIYNLKKNSEKNVFFLHLMHVFTSKYGEYDVKIVLEKNVCANPSKKGIKFF